MRQFLILMVWPLWACTAFSQPIQTGKAFPSVSFPAVVTATGDTVAYDSFKGRWILLDFWATWCGPCVEELPLIGRAIEQFGDSLVVISVSLDDSPGDVEAFRKRIHPMNWNHLFLGSDSQLVYDLDISTIPRPVLIAPDGTVAAYHTDLRGLNLIPTLAKALRAPVKTTD